MSNPKYINFKAVKHVYVNSLSQYYFEILFMMHHRGEFYPRRVWYSPQFGFEWNAAPKYAHTAAKRAIVELLKSGNAKFYERDRDGNDRYENLRYHDLEYVQQIISVLEAA